MTENKFSKHAFFSLLSLLGSSIAQQPDLLVQNFQSIPQTSAVSLELRTLEISKIDIFKHLGEISQRKNRVGSSRYCKHLPLRGQTHNDSKRITAYFFWLGFLVPTQTYSSYCDVARYGEPFSVSQDFTLF